MHTDIPDRARVGRLLAHRGPCRVSIYLPTDHASPGDAERIEFKNLAAFVKPLLRSVTFPQVGFVLALAQRSVRLVEVAADAGVWEVSVDGMPTDVASAVGKSSIADRAPSGRIQGSESQKVRMRQYARAIDRRSVRSWPAEMCRSFWRPPSPWTVSIGRSTATPTWPR